MRKLKIFEVVELKDENKATIIAVDNISYKARITNVKGENEGVKNITEEEINKIIYEK